MEDIKNNTQARIVQLEKELDLEGLQDFLDESRLSVSTIVEEIAKKQEPFHAKICSLLIEWKKAMDYEKQVRKFRGVYLEVELVKTCEKVGMGRVGLELESRFDFDKEISAVQAERDLETAELRKELGRAQNDVNECLGAIRNVEKKKAAKDSVDRAPDTYVKRFRVYMGTAEESVEKDKEDALAERIDLLYDLNKGILDRDNGKAMAAYVHKYSENRNNFEPHKLGLFNGIKNYMLRMDILKTAEADARERM